MPRIEMHIWCRMQGSHGRHWMNHAYNYIKRNYVTQPASWVGPSSNEFLWTSGRAAKQATKPLPTWRATSQLISQWWLRRSVLVLASWFEWCLWQCWCGLTVGNTPRWLWQDFKAMICIYAQAQKFQGADSNTMNMRLTATECDHIHADPEIWQRNGGHNGITVNAKITCRLMGGWD